MRTQCNGRSEIDGSKIFSFFVLVVVILYDAVVVDSFPSQGSKNFYGHAWSGPGALEAVQTPAAITSTNSFSILLLLMLTMLLALMLLWTISLGAESSRPRWARP